MQPSFFSERPEARSEILSSCNVSVYESPPGFITRCVAASFETAGSSAHNRESVKGRLTCSFGRYTMRFGCRRYDRSAANALREVRDLIRPRCHAMRPLILFLLPRGETKKESRCHNVAHGRQDGPICRGEEIPRYPRHPRLQKLITVLIPPALLCLFPLRARMLAAPNQFLARWSFSLVLAGFAFRKSNSETRRVYWKS